MYVVLELSPAPAGKACQKFWVPAEPPLTGSMFLQL
jgi:hypothetical protein